MFIRILTITILVGITFSVIALFYIRSHSPFNIDKLQEYAVEKEVAEDDDEALIALIRELVESGGVVDYLSPNAYAGFGIVIAALMSFFSALHFTVDKLFFKEFYENPSIYLAVRRTIFFGITCAGIVYFILINASIVEISSILLLVGGIEALFNMNFDKQIRAYLTQNFFSKTKQT
jgi:hypothetical protein